MNVNIKDLENKLSDPSPEVRRRAVGMLQLLDPESVLDLVIGALGDEDWRVRKETIALLAAISPTDTLLNRTIEALLQESNIGLRNAASEALSRMGNLVIDSLIERLDSLSLNGQIIALEVVGRSTHPASLKTLISALDSEENTIRVCAAELLCEQGGQEAMEALVGCLSGEDPLLTLAALQSLNQIGAQVDYDKLTPLATDPIYGIEVLLCMARSGTASVVPYILDRLVDEPTALKAFDVLYTVAPHLEPEIVEMLGAMSPAVIEILKERALNGDSVERRIGIRVLLWSRDVSHIQFITKFAKDGTLFPTILEGFEKWGAPAISGLEKLLPIVQEKTLASVVGLLARLSDEKSAGYNKALFNAYLHSSDVMVATAAAGAVGKFGDETSIGRLIELCGSEDRRAARGAAHALSQIGLRHAEEVRQAILKEEIEGEKGVVLCGVLESVGQPEDLHVLVAALSSTLPKLRKAVLGAVSTIGGQASLDIISLAMMDEDKSVQLACAGALSRIGPVAAETIVSALHTATGPLRAALVKALGTVGHPEAEAILKPLVSQSSDVAMAAFKAMRNLEIDTSSVLDEIFHHEDSEVVKMALSFLTQDFNRDKLFGLLDHSAWDVRLAVVEILSKSIDEAPVISLIQTALQSENDDLVRMAMERLVKGKEG